MKLCISVVATLFLLTVCVDIASATTLVNGANQTGTILANTTNFNGKLQLYGSNGMLLKKAEGSTDNLIAYTASNCGTFTILVSSDDFNGADTGTYGLTANRLEDSMRVCFPVISGASLTVNGVGGPHQCRVRPVFSHEHRHAFWTLDTGSNQPVQSVRRVQLHERI
jgi:hypothetical protein